MVNLQLLRILKISTAKYLKERFLLLAVTCGHNKQKDLAETLF